MSSPQHSRKNGGAAPAAGGESGSTQPTKQQQPPPPPKHHQQKPPPPASVAATNAVVTGEDAYFERSTRAGCVVFVGNLRFDAPWQIVKDKFQEAGRVRYCDLVADPDTGRPRGTALVTMATAEGATAAVQRLNDVMFEGRRLSVRLMEPGRRPRLVGPEHMPHYRPLVDRIPTAPPAAAAPSAQAPASPAKQPSQPTTAASANAQPAAPEPTARPTPDSKNRAEDRRLPRNTTTTNTNQSATASATSSVAAAVSSTTTNGTVVGGSNSSTSTSNKPPQQTQQQPQQHQTQTHAPQQQQQQQQQQPAMPIPRPRSQQPDDTTRRLLVSNLPFDCSMEALRDTFMQVGNVTRAEIFYSRNGRSRGAGIVVMATAAEAQTAIHEFDGIEMAGRPMSVRLDDAAVVVQPPHVVFGGRV